MKTLILYIFLLFALLLTACTTKENYNYKVTVVPDTESPYLTQSDINATAQILSKRLINTLSIPQENISTDISENKISLTISNADTSKIATIKKTISGRSKLEFLETYENSEILGSLSKANDLIKTSLSTSDASLLFGILKPMLNETGEPLPSCMIGLAGENDTAEVNKYLKLEQVLAVFPADIRFYWSAKPYRYDPSKSSYALHAIKAVQNRIPLDGSAIVSASTVKGESDTDVKILLTMSTEGAEAFAGITRANINRCIAVVYNGYVRSYPRVMGEISGGSIEISGDFTAEEAKDFADLLNSGQLPFDLKIVNEQIIKSE